MEGRREREGRGERVGFVAPDHAGEAVEDNIEAERRDDGRKRRRADQWPDDNLLNDDPLHEAEQEGERRRLPPGKAQALKEPVGEEVVSIAISPWAKFAMSVMFSTTTMAMPTIA